MEERDKKALRELWRRFAVTMGAVMVFALFFLFGILMTGCGTKRVTEYVVTHDTLRVTKTDTIYKSVGKTCADTVRIETERVITLQGADTVKVVEYRDRWRDRYLSQTDTVYRAKTDTIYKVQEAVSDKTAERQPTWWQRNMWHIAILVACGVFLCFVWALIRERLKKP